jgi:hypothetical protein
MLRFALTLCLLLVAFACGTPAPKCTTANCTGCCDQMTDTCRAGSEATACGVGGTLCVACPSTQTCRSDRTCGSVAMNTSCGASNCDGCCDTSGTCFKGQVADFCGAGGAACRVCASSQTCQRVDASSEFGGRCTP